MKAELYLATKCLVSRDFAPAVAVGFLAKLGGLWTRYPGEFSEPQEP